MEMSYPNKRDCEHGSQRGKCELCDMEKRIAELEASVAWYSGRHEEDDKIVDAIESENAWLRKNAERYAYLRLCAFDESMMNKLAEINDEPETPEEFDAAIDTAISKIKESP